jgi:hypothetical protein
MREKGNVNKVQYLIGLQQRLQRSIRLHVERPEPTDSNSLWQVLYLAEATSFVKSQVDQ